MDDLLGLPAVDGLQLNADRRAILTPGEFIRDASGAGHHLPRFFLQVPSWEAAREIAVTSHFKLSELIMVDCRESDLQLRQFPHYVPCAIVVLARYLEAFRAEVGGSVFVAANGGYRSPAHQLNRANSLHQWATAANIYRVGDTYLDNEKSIERYARIASALGKEVFARPPREGDDHLHIDIGFVTLTPRDCNEALP